MPQFSYKGRDKEGKLRIGHRVALNAAKLGDDLLKEGISPIQILPYRPAFSYREKINDFLQGENLQREELAIFARQMQLLHQAGVGIVPALKQLAGYTRSFRLARALQGVTEHLEMGQDLATSMQYYPEAFSPLMVNVVRIGENTGHLSEAFGQLFKYIEFESHNAKQMRSSFRYPIFVFVAIFLSIIILNIFVVPTFARFYTNAEITLPWQTRVLIGSSHFFIHYGIYCLIFLIGLGIAAHYYLKTPQGKYRLGKYQLRVPLVGKLLKRIILMRFAQSFAIVLGSGISVTQGLGFVKEVIDNKYVSKQIGDMQEMIERGQTLTKSLSYVDLFSPLELQILSVGEKNGELVSALEYMTDFQSHEIEFELKRLSDAVGPILISVMSVLILIVALGVYLPIWNMVNAR
ncbi:MAG TPA: type II secretion system F family protein [Gammaproteobacteria bacterium]|jgi:MSHA biogenesis protein MshG|nr:type II secretion system F family protein [Gammaproteobacteria bacterium]